MNVTDLSAFAFQSPARTGVLLHNQLALLQDGTFAWGVWPLLPHRRPQLSPPTFSAGRGRLRAMSQSARVCWLGAAAALVGAVWLLAAAGLAGGELGTTPGPRAGLPPQVDVNHTV